MITAFFSNIGGMISRFVAKYIFDRLAKMLTAWIERRQRAAEQAKKDEASKPTYDQAIKEGTHEDIVKATEDRLNG